MEASQTTDIERERSVGEILSVAFTMYRRYPLLFAALAVGVIAPYELAKLAVTGTGPFGGGGSGNAGALVLFELLYYVLVGPLISAFHVHAVVEIGAGRAPRFGPVALRGLRVLPVVAAAQIIAGILIALGFVALIVPGILLSLGWAVVAQTAAVDNDGWMPALRRSRKLTAGHYLHVFGLQLTIGLLTGFVGVVAGVSITGNAASVASVLVGIVVYTILASFTALTLAILYFDLCARESGPARSSIPEHGHPGDMY